MREDISPAGGTRRGRGGRKAASGRNWPGRGAQAVWLCCDCKDEVARPSGRMDAVQTAQIICEVGGGAIAGVRPLVRLLVRLHITHGPCVKKHGCYNGGGDVCQFHGVSHVKGCLAVD